MMTKLCILIVRSISAQFKSVATIFLRTMTRGLYFRMKCFWKKIYKTAVGFYIFAGCSIIDLVFALRVGDTAPFRYIPMLVSMKSHVYCGPQSAKMECKSMTQKFEVTAGGAKLGALCLLVVFGSPSSPNDGGYTLEPSCVDSLTKGTIVSKVLRVPTYDEFGLSEAFQDLTVQDEMSEVLASHSFVGAHREGDRDPSFAEKAFRFRPKNEETGDSMATTMENLLEGLDKIVEQK